MEAITRGVEGGQTFFLTFIIYHFKKSVKAFPNQSPNWNVDHDAGKTQNG